MKTVYKYPLKIVGLQTVKMQTGGQILCAQMQNSQLFLWALVETENTASPDSRMIEIFGTGHEIPPGERRYIGTVQQHGGALIWHVFERAG